MSFKDLPVSDRFPAYYEGTGGESGAAAGEVVAFRYVDGSQTAPDGGEPAYASAPVAAQVDDAEIDWDDAEGVQAVAQAILLHYTGEEPGQAALEALVMDQGDTWASGSEWRLTTAELEAII